MWWQLRNFIVRQVEFNRFLHPNEHPQRIFWYLVRLFDWEPSKIWHILLSKPCLEMNWISFISDNVNPIHFQTWLCKNVPNLWWLSIKQSYKISKNLLRMFIWMQKSITFHLPLYAIIQLSSCYCLLFELEFILCPF